MKYPKAGEPIPTVKLFVWEVGTRSPAKLVEPPRQVTDWTDYIYTNAVWSEKYVLR